MIKTYKANTDISINVVLKSKANLHVSFVPLSNGSSVYTTDREDVQEAIEAHYKFGLLFVLDSTQGLPKDNANVTVEGPAANEGAVQEEAANIEGGDENDTEPEAETGTGEDLKKVTVSDIATAKDYLADHCGVSRTQMRSTKSILAQAAANGIEFVGI